MTSTNIITNTVSTNVGVAPSWAVKARQCFRNSQVLVLDCGRNSATYYDGTGQVAQKITLEELLSLPRNQKYNGFFFVGENAHLGVKTSPSSLSQPFSEEQLKQFYKDCEDNNIMLRLFPQQSTPKAARFAGLEKSDENDPVSIYKYLEDRVENVSLRNPNPDFETPPVREEGNEVKRNVSAVTNHVRRWHYTDELSKFLFDNIEYLCENLSDESKEVFGLTDESRFKVKSQKGEMNFNKVKVVLLMSLLSIAKGKVATNEDGNFLSLDLNVRDQTNKLPSWSFVKKYVLNLSPFHFRGGVARSNLMYHGERFYISKKIAEDKLVEKGSDFRKYKVGEVLSGYVLKDNGDRVQITNSEELSSAFSKYRKQYRDSLKECYNLLRGLAAKDSPELV